MQHFDQFCLRGSGNHPGRRDERSGHPRSQPLPPEGPTVQDAFPILNIVDSPRSDDIYIEAPCSGPYITPI